MADTRSDGIELVRLTRVDVEDVHRVLAEPRIRRHMPLAGDMTLQDVATWIDAKDALWDQVGYGPWAVLAAGAVVGWGGFQPEAAGPDLALVLLPTAWGAGMQIVRQMLDTGFREFGFDEVYVALPYTRGPSRWVDSLGFTPAGKTRHDGTLFRRYRLLRSSWADRRQAT